MIISIDTENAFGKIQNIFKIKQNSQHSRDRAQLSQVDKVYLQNNYS